MKKDIKIPKQAALFLLHYGLIDDTKAEIVCKDFANDDGDFVEVLKEDICSLNDDKEYNDFEIWVK
ncbi:MAG: hypothetical protein KAQ87_04805 [Candidatus Pacebacteria bacterium]|nr:hypothetical protein [Candidatus Paceibacterota bacterium]